MINYLLTQFTSVLVIAPGIWRPRFKGGIATIEQMAVVRADAGVQFVLFNSTMDAARVVVEMVRKLQLLVGQVERVTEMLDLLVRILLNFFLPRFSSSSSSGRWYIHTKRVSTFHCRTKLNKQTWLQMKVLSLAHQSSSRTSRSARQQA